MIVSVLDRPSLRDRRVGRDEIPPLLNGERREGGARTFLPLQSGGGVSEAGGGGGAESESPPSVAIGDASTVNGGGKSRAALQRMARRKRWGDCIPPCLLTLTIALSPASAQNAADEYYDPAEMAAARHMLRHHHGGTAGYFLEGERLEYRTGEGDPVFGWDAQGWYGGDVNKFWAKSEGEVGLADGVVEDGEVQALYSRAIGAFFDVQGGVRRDFGEGPNRTHAVIGIQGLAPYLFEVDAAAFVSGHGDVTARVEAEYELLLTQRLILQPRTELEFSAQEVPELGLGSGLTSAEVGARLRYEVTRRFAPYVGVSWERDVGGTADFTRANGEDPGDVSFVAGLRLWL